MTQKLTFIDHTMDGILQRKKRGCPSENTFSILLKYPIETLEIQFNNFIGARYKKIHTQIKSRVEVKNIEEVNYLLNHFYHPSFLDLMFLIQEDTNVDEVINYLEKSIPKGLGYSIGYFAKETNLEESLKTICEKLSPCRLRSFIFCDDRGLFDPFQTQKILNYLKDKLSCTIEYRPGNENDLATANAIAALYCGMEKIHTVIGGAGAIGAPMEEVLMASRYFQLNNQVHNTSELSKDCKRILRELNVVIPLDKSIIGSYVFAHESGIHVDGVIKNPSLYEVFRPEEVGLQRKIVIGKHSGKAAIQLKYKELGITLNDEHAILILNETKKLSQKQKGELSNQQLIAIYHTLFANRLTKGACI